MSMSSRIKMAIYVLKKFQKSSLGKTKATENS